MNQRLLVLASPNRKYVAGRGEVRTIFRMYDISTAWHLNFEWKLVSGLTCYPLFCCRYERSDNKDSWRQSGLSGWIRMPFQDQSRNRRRNGHHRIQACQVNTTEFRYEANLMSCSLITSHIKGRESVLSLVLRYGKWVIEEGLWRRGGLTIPNIVLAFEFQCLLGGVPVLGM